ncbi:MAG: hypothetical protein IBX72_10670 [Nitrospirae bacterium]|jgi:hypothetical protein|nr:hypothetical protein [Nitrospirota bacterium]
MFKFIKRLIVFTAIAVIVFLVLSFWRGGEPFRWFGKKTEKAGEVIKYKSEEIGEEADKIKRTTDGIKETTEKVTKGIKKTGDKVKDITGANDEKEGNGD